MKKPTTGRILGLSSPFLSASCEVSTVSVYHQTSPLGLSHQPAAISGTSSPLGAPAILPAIFRPRPPSVIPSVASFAPRGRTRHRHRRPYPRPSSPGTRSRRPSPLLSCRFRRRSLAGDGPSPASLSGPAPTPIPRSSEPLTSVDHIFHVEHHKPCHLSL